MITSPLLNPVDREEGKLPEKVAAGRGGGLSAAGVTCACARATAAIAGCSETFGFHKSKAAERQCLHN
ncbi:hypothetical protein GCM10017744_036230 [Streptomyces antimycoticus]